MGGEDAGAPKGRWRVALAVAAFVAIAVGVVFVLRHRRAAAHTAPARNVILVTIDTLRADALGYAGNTRVRTPFLDSLASRGLVFTNAHAHNVITLPSHTNILTGLYPFQHGVRENSGFKLDPKHETVATMLRRIGYTTGAFIAAFPLDSRFGLNQGFDTYDDNYGKGQASVDFIIQERHATAVLDAAMRWWGAHQGQKRFMWIHLYDPHAPYSPPEPFLEQYRDNEYLGEVAYVDDALSKTLGPLVAADPDALVIVTADHGEALGDHGEKTHGLFAYESTLKIPMIIAGHGLAHRIVPEYVRHIDIVPTILDAAQAARPPALPGTSLLEERLASRDSYFEALSASLNRGWAPLTGIIHSSQKYIDLPIAEFYDLPRDPRELNNLRNDRRRNVEEARRLLAPMHGEPAMRSAISSEEVAKLRSLGYVAGNAATKQVYTAADDPKNLVGLDAKMHDAIDLFERGQPRRALELAREVVAERGDMDAGRQLFAFMLQQNDMVPQAIEELKKLVAKPDAIDDDVVQLALLLSETGRADAALAVLAPRSARTSDADLLNAYGVALSDAGRPDEAHRQFERALSIDANNAPAIQNLGILALKRGDAATAEASLSRALELNPRLPLALNTLGVVYAQRGDFPRAIDSWKRSVEVDPRQYDALLNIGIAEGRTGHRDEARHVLQRFVQTAPKSRYAADIANAQRMLAALR
jgi:arylsulfatase A-like enzyme/tetratricopeptide (TPR) repeat protein